MSRSIKILMNRYKKFMNEAEYYKKQGLFLKLYDEDKLNKLYALIIGTDDTPYDHGLFLFEITCDETFPYEPPNVQYLTTDGNIRMTPNYYQCGKVCLSIINTWGEKGWSAQYKFDSILIQFQSQLQKYSLRCEPSHERDAPTSQHLIEYENYVTYHSINYAFCHMVELCLSEKEERHPIASHFKDEVLEHARDNIDDVIKNYYTWIESQKTRIHEGLISGSIMYGGGAYKYNLTNLETRLLMLKERIQIKPS
jgi:ubiquitin-conjugating enzyme E2 O